MVDNNNNGLTLEQREELLEMFTLALQRNPRGLGEYELLQNVKEHPVFRALEGTGNRQLFRRHFVLRHCVYYLQQRLWEREGWIVSITPLTISIQSAREGENGLSGDVVDPGLRDYYLDWNNFDATEEEVSDLLNNFWRDYGRYIQQDDAWQILGLPVDSSLSQITARYRELAAQHHPDKGGDQETFIKIRAAYESLRLTKK